MAMPVNTAPQEDPATPEEEAAMQAGLDWVEGKLYGDENAIRAMAKMLKSAPTPAEGLGQAAAQLTIGCDRELDLPETVILPLCEQVLTMVAEVMEEAQVADWQEADLERAMTMATQTVMGEYGADEVEMQAAAQGAGIYSPQSMQQMASRKGGQTEVVNG